MRPRVRIFAPALALPPTVCSTGKDVITMSRIYTALVKPIMPRPVCFLSRLRPGPAFSLLRLATTRKLGKTRPSTISVPTLSDQSRQPLSTCCRFIVSRNCKGCVGDIVPPLRLCRIAVFSLKPTFLSLALELRSLRLNTPLLCRLVIF